MSIFDRMNQIERQINTLDTAFTSSIKTAAPTTPGVKGVNAAAEGPSFQSIMNTMTNDQRFTPGVSSACPTSSCSGDSSQFDSIIDEASQKYNVDKSLIKAVIRQESAFNPQATSWCGAQGLMQLMPDTAKGLGVTNSLDPRDNIMGGTKYLSQLMQQFDGNLTKTIAAYNAGPGAVAEHGGVPPYTETQDYVSKVLGYYQENKGNQA